MSHQHSEEDWVHCTLCRAERQGQAVFHKAKQRRIDWPRTKQYSTPPVQDPLVYTSIDDAFSSVLQYMTTTSRQCRRYYSGCSQTNKNHQDQDHCRRFHTPKYTMVQRRNPLQSAEDVHVVVHPGSYAVTAGAWGSPRQQTHIVNVDRGQSVNLDFVF
ncbi:A-kinase-interacting protein 1 [Lingula anatina]|uniref:A-kinase-interacting protein 1 n=1 Tax=Lingula anatina TaxID=7574 RepID=A0A1S3K360_LINAN|nr:A-kinase-interacting protein 1-like [Lingula anatina]XP_013417060.1 A-kinase-interacting protein 1 [Lingula anatina]|eukprot:XP_013417059.1 A-kinase-interacting protein 1-like [Lingula anatina]